MSWGCIRLTLATLALCATTRAWAQSVDSGAPDPPASPSAAPAPETDRGPPLAPSHYAPPPAPTYGQPPSPYGVPPVPPYPAPLPVGPAPVPLVLEGDGAELRMVLSFDEGEPPFARCRGRCMMSVLPGRYTLTVGATREVSQKSETLDIQEPSRVTVAPQPGRQHPLALVGFITVVSGAALIAFGSSSDEDSTQRTYMGAGFLGIVAGIVLMPIGAGLSSDDHLDVQVEPL